MENKSEVFTGEQFEQVLLSLGDIKIINRKDSICANVRTKFDPDKAASLREDIKKKGLINSLIVRRLGDSYELLAGERRLRSLIKLVGENVSCWSIIQKKLVPAKVLYSKISVKCIECDDITALGISISDNVERENLTEIEKISACIKLDEALDKEGEQKFTRPQIADMFRVSESWVSQTIKIGKLPKYAIDALSDGIINRTAALQLLKTDPAKVSDVINYAKRLVEHDFMQKIEAAIADVEKSDTELQSAMVDVDMADLKKKTAPSNKKGDADRLQKKARETLSKAVDAADIAKERLSALNRTHHPSVTSITADDVSKANEELGVRTGKSRPLSTKQIRETKEEIVELLKATKSKKSKRDLSVMLMTVQLLLREIDATDIMDALESVAD